jgi:predicted phage terminase large subunit-like protein
MAATALAQARDELWRARLPFSPHVPTSRQAKFLLLPQFEALYGGAAGGGKSDAMLMAATQYAHVPGYAAIIFRKTFADLSKPGAIMDRAKAWFLGQPGVRWNDNDKQFTFACPGGGSSTLTFAYLQHENDKYNYQGAEFQFIGWDELTQFSETQYTYLISRCRRPKDTDGDTPLGRVPLRIRGASNPGGVGHAWVLARFLESAREETTGAVWKTGAEVDLMAGRAWIRDLPFADDKGRTRHEDRVFVPAKLEDNPHLDTEEYDKGLQELDAVTRAQLRRGDWTVRPKGPLFDRTWFGIVEASKVPTSARRWRYWDMAATQEKPGTDPDWTVGARCAFDDDEGILYVEHVDRFRERPAGVEARVKANAEVDGRDVPVTLEQEPGSSGVIVIDYYVRRVLPGRAVYGDKKTGSKVEMARPLSALAERGGVKLVRGHWNGAFLDELEAFPFGEHDDQEDAVAGAHRWLTDSERSTRETPSASELPRGRLSGRAADVDDFDDDEALASARRL